MATADSSRNAGEGRFGTFGGVFTPCVLTILGVIMFLRFGQVVGQAGLIHAVVIIALAKAITTLTAFSLSAIATNTRVKGGGAYFLISRSLGAEFGGAIGVVFYLAQAVSVALYVIGFTEAMHAAFPGIGIPVQVTATVVNLIVFVCVFIGAGWTIRLQYAILAVLGLALLSFVAGAVPEFSVPTLTANFGPGYQPEHSFFTMFALFFPAATGIMAGANMSGDLREPGKSIPAGTLAAIGATTVVYLALALLLAGSRPRAELVANNFVVNDIAIWSWLIVAGVFAATLSSALGSMMGAPRILQAFARDNLLPHLKLFGKGSGPTNEPRRATVLTFAIAEVALLAGDLDVLAPAITMFFMITYGTLNLACFYEGYTRNPSYRPVFRFSHWSLGLAGAVGCAAVMLLMAPLAAIVAIAAMWSLHWAIGRMGVEARWGDVKSGIAFERARRSLLKLEDERYHPKNWRPSILALSEEKWSNHFRLAEYGYWLTAGRGVFSLGQVSSGDVEQRAMARRREESGLRKFIRNQELEAFPAAVVEPDLLTGTKSLLQSHGIGGLRPNTVMLAWRGEREEAEPFGRMLRLARAMDRSFLIVRCDPQAPRWSVPEGTIDVWWRDEKKGALMLIFAHLLTQARAWRNRTIRLLHEVQSEVERERAARRLADVIKVARLKVEPEIVVGRDLGVDIRRVSSQAALVFIGCDPPEEGDEIRWQQEWSTLMQGFSEVILVYHAGDVALEA